MENNENLKLTLAGIVNNAELRGSLFSTFRCPLCGKKMLAGSSAVGLYFYCEELDNVNAPKYPGKKLHGSFHLNLDEIALILNFNPLL